MFQNFLKILGILAEYQVDFIVVGGVSAALNGAPMNTFDVDVVHSTSPENLPKLLSALKELDAYYRIQPERKLRPNESHLSGLGHQLLVTKLGHADFLGSVTRKRTYEDLLPETEEMEIAGSYRVRVLTLGMLITLKEETGRPKDLAQLPTLRATLEEIKRRKKKKDEPDPEDGEK